MVLSTSDEQGESMDLGLAALEIGQAHRLDVLSGGESLSLCCVG